MSSAHSPTFPSLYLHHSSFSNPSVTLPMSQLILQPFHCFTYVKAHSRAHSPTFPSLHLRHSSLSNPSVALPKSQLILQLFRCFLTSQLILQPSIYIFLIILRAAVIADYKIIMDILNIIIGTWAARLVN